VRVGRRHRVTTPGCGNRVRDKEVSITREKEPEDRSRADEGAADETATGKAVSNGDLEAVVGGVAPSQIGPSSDLTQTTIMWGDPI
jgi:hypothetical protein